MTVDGETTSGAEILWSIGSVSGSLEQLQASRTARWPLDVPADLRIPRVEPLSIGFHDVSVELRITMSYIPEELQPSVWTERRRLVITR